MLVRPVRLRRSAAQLSSYTPEEVESHWHWLLTVIDLAAIGAGTGLVYRCNGGQDGIDFAGRLFALWWVVGIRLAIIMIPVAVVVLALLKFPWGDVSVTVGVSLLFYWRLAVHMRSLRYDQTTNAQNLL
jgi:uncharacterized membrane-anchored protein YitT (DUF2179 family)